MTRFKTYWFDPPEERIPDLEDQLGQAETECDTMREFLDEARQLLREAKFDDPGDFYDAQHWLAEVDMHLEAQ